MKAILHTKYGPAEELKLGEINKPLRLKKSVRLNDRRQPKQARKQLINYKGQSSAFFFGWWTPKALLYFHRMVHVSPCAQSEASLLNNIAVRLFMRKCDLSCEGCTYKWKKERKMNENEKVRIRIRMKMKNIWVRT